MDEAGEVREDLSNVKQVKEKKSKAKRIREQELEDMRLIMDTAEGRYFIWRILCECKIFESLSGYTSERMHERSGMRDVGLWMIAQLEEASPNAYLELVRESKVREDG